MPSLPSASRSACSLRRSGARDAATFAKKGDPKQRPIDQKESQKWLTSLAAVAEVHKQCPDTQIVSVGDAEADVYDLFVASRPAGVDLLVRAGQNRCVAGPQKLLWAALEDAPCWPSVRCRCRVATATLHALPC